MVERKLKIAVIAMMIIAGIYAFDDFYKAGGITGYAVNSASGRVDCSDTDNGNPFMAGITDSTAYPDGYRTDKCYGNELLEYYCTETGPDARAVNCPNGCIDGACK